MHNLRGKVNKKKINLQYVFNIFVKKHKIQP